MSNDRELPSDSDEDDEDYVPGGGESEPGSEVDSEGDVESGQESGENNENIKETKTPKGKGKKRSARGDKGGRKKLRNNTGAGNNEPAQKTEDKKLSEEEEKKRADSLWADFMMDTSATPKIIPKSRVEDKKEDKFLADKVSKAKGVEKVKITKLFEFAGEEVRVEKEVLADSAEARLSLPSTNVSKSEANNSGGSGGGRGGIKRGGLGGISSVLGQLGKKAKISVLEKSKLDWDSYKKREDIEEEITTHNKGKGGYLEKQDFLQRADLRQFEIEKQLRSSRRSAR